MTETDFSTPRRMSPGAFAIMLLKSFREFFGVSFVMIGYVAIFNSDDKSFATISVRILIALAIIVGLALLTTFTRYYFRKFHVEGDKLIFSQGYASKRTSSIPLSRIHTLRTKKGLLYRLLGMRGITFDTLASKYEEVELILDEDDWQMLLDRVRDGENLALKPDAPPAAPSENDTQRVSNLNIIKGALCQNHLKGFAVLATVFFALLDKINQLSEDTATRFLDYLDSQASGSLPTGWQWVWFFAAIYLIVMLLWTGKIILRYSNMSMRIIGSRITIESGLISRFTCRLARNKVTILRIKRNPLEKMARCNTITLRQAGNASGTKEEGNISIYGSNFGSELLTWWLGDNDNQTRIFSAKSGRGLFFRKFIPNLIVALGATYMINHFAGLAPALAVSCGYAAFAAVRAVMAWRHSRIILNDSYVEISRGNVALIREYIKYCDIESAAIRMTPFTPRTRRVSISIATNAGAATVYSLERDAAFKIRNVILSKIASYSSAECSCAGSSAFGSAVSASD